MTCFTVPMATTAVLFLFGKNLKKEVPQLHSLNLMLGGGSAMLLLDHWWNNELFLLNQNLGADLALGFLMTAGTILLWGIFTAASIRTAKTTAAKSLN